MIGEEHDLYKFTCKYKTLLLKNRIDVLISRIYAFNSTTASKADNGQAG